MRAAIGTFICALTIAYVGVYVYGTMRPGIMVPYIAASHPIRYGIVVDRLTPAGQKAGLRPGDTLLYERLTPTQRYAMNMWGGYQTADGESIIVPYFRDGKPVPITHRAVAAPADQWVATYVFDFLLAFLTAFGSLLIIKGKDRPSLWAGIFFVSAGYGLPYSFGGIVGLPGIGNVAMAVASIAAGAVVPVALYVFAEAMLAPSTPALTRWIFRLLNAPGILSNTYVLVYGLLFLFTGNNAGWGIFRGPLGSVPMIVEFAAVVYVLGYAMLQSDQPQRVAARIIFWSSLIGLSGTIIDIIFVAFGMGFIFDSELSLTIAVMPVGIAYAVFTKHLYDIDFFISRAVVFAAVIGLVVAVIALMESLIESAVLGHIGGIIVAVLVPIALGFSMRWIEQRVSAITEHVLYREKSRAHTQLRELIDDFSEAHDANLLCARVAREIHRAFKSACIIYRFTGDFYDPVTQQGTASADVLPITQDDPAFMRLRRTRRAVDTRDLETAVPCHGMLFPLATFGRISGALLVGGRLHQQSYDPDDQSLFTELSHELGIALLCLRDEMFAAAIS